MKNKIAAVVLAASMFGTAVMPAANVFAAEAAETEEATALCWFMTRTRILRKRFRTSLRLHNLLFC